MKRKIDATAVIFAAYLLLLIWIVLFKMTFSFSGIGWFEGERSVNLIPFYYEKDIRSFHIREVLANILIFVPLGIYLKMFGISWEKAVLIGSLFSLALELFQFTAAIGSADITDLITNTAGTLAGVCLYLTSGMLFRTKGRTDRGINTAASVLLLFFTALVILLAIAN